MKTKKIVHLVIFVIMMFGALVGNAPPVIAQNDQGDFVSFSLLAQTEIGLQGPADIQSFRFNIPAGWDLLDGGRLYLQFNTFFNDTSGTGESEIPVAGYLQVTLNDIPLGTIVLNKRGENSIELPVPLSVWDGADPTKPARLEFNLRTPGPCNTSYLDYSSNLYGGLSVLIHSSSFFYLPHLAVPIVTDLRQLPYPIYQDSFIPDKVVLVIPDSPTEMELQAALTTSAVFGRLSGGELGLETSTIGRLNSSTLGDSHIVFVGKPSAFPQFSSAVWPAPLTDQGFAVPQLSVDDGVIQMAISPQSPAHVWLMISGLSDAGVVKAAQAVGRGPEIRVTQNPGLSIVSDSQESPILGLESVERTLEDLGYDNQETSGAGLRYIVYNFEIPLGQEVSHGAYLDLAFTHSAMLDFEGSGVTVSLNGDYIGSFRFSAQTARVTNWHLDLPSSSFEQGENDLLLTVNLVAISSCLPLNQLWFSSRSDSILHMALEASPVQEANPLLPKYPAPFDPILDRTAVVVAKNDPDSWIIASRIAYDLGSKMGGPRINLVAAFADSVPDFVRSDHDLILVGRPSLMPFIQELAPTMPAPFDVGSDIAKEPPTGFTFQVPGEIPVGYLQVFPVPWDTQRLAMTISGNGVEGLNWAADALVDPEKFSQLRGNFAILYENQIITAQVDLGQITGLGTPVTATQTAQATLAEETTEATPSAWSPLTMIVVSAIVVFTLVLIGFFLVRKGFWRNKQKADTSKR